MAFFPIALSSVYLYTLQPPPFSLTQSYSSVFESVSVCWG